MGCDPGGYCAPLGLGRARWPIGSRAAGVRRVLRAVGGAWAGADAFFRQLHSIICAGPGFLPGALFIGVCAEVGIFDPGCRARDLVDKRSEPPVLSVFRRRCVVVRSSVGITGRRPGWRGEVACGSAVGARYWLPVDDGGGRGAGAMRWTSRRGWRLADSGACEGGWRGLLCRDAGARTLGSSRQVRRSGWPRLAGRLTAADESSWLHLTRGLAPRRGPLTFQSAAGSRLGVGCARNCPPRGRCLRWCMGRWGGQGHRAGGDPGSLHHRPEGDEPAVLALARELDVAVAPVVGGGVERRRRGGQSVGGGVRRGRGMSRGSEGAALAGAGAEAVLTIGGLRQTANATMALAGAGAHRGIAGPGAGAARSVVGIGPGSRRRGGRRMVKAGGRGGGTHWYGLYIDLLGPVAAGKRARISPGRLGSESWGPLRAGTRGRGAERPARLLGRCGHLCHGRAESSSAWTPGPGRGERAARWVKVVCARGFSALSAAGGEGMGRH